MATPTQVPAYAHTQKSPLCLSIYATALGMLVIAVLLRNEPEVPFISPLFFVVGGMTAVLAPAIHHLTVADRGEVLAIRFGPLPLLRRTVRYDNMEKVEVGRTLFLDGWGIHYSLRGGWVWNIWGRDCVVVHLRQGVLRIGTDDAANLARFLEGKIVSREPFIGACSPHPRES